MSARAASVLVLLGLAVFWAAVLLAASGNPGYSHWRDYVSPLASRGAERGWLGVLAIAFAGLAMLPAALLVQRLSRTAAIAIALAGIGFVVVAFTRLECASGAARCGLGGRFAISGRTEIQHWAATTVSTVLLVAGICLAGLALVRQGSRLAGAITVGAAAATTGAFLATGGQSPGATQRLGIVVATGWLAALAIASLQGREPPQPASSR